MKHVLYQVTKNGAWKCEEYVLFANCVEPVHEKAMTRTTANPEMILNFHGAQPHIALCSAGGTENIIMYNVNYVYNVLHNIMPISADVRR